MEPHVRQSTGAAGITYRPYRVTGATAGDLRQAIALVGPRLHGRAFAGLTTWTIRWSYRPVRDGGAVGAGTVRPGEVRVVLEGVVRLPEWRPTHAAPAALCEAWRSYVLALASHEAGHVALARAAADDIVALLAGGRAATASGLALAMETQARAGVAEAREAERSYDRATQHGRTQGASWRDHEELPTCA